MRITFIFASMSYEKGIKECVDSILYASGLCSEPETEIICVFQGINEKRPFFENNKSVKSHYLSEFGLARARNHGIKNSSGDYMVFIDDHASVDKSFIEQLKNTIKLYAADAYGGRILDPITGVSFTPASNNNSAIKLSRARFRYFMGSSHIISRMAIEKIGYYDENFGRGSKFFGAEESDMFFRLINAGFSVYFIPGLIFYHKVYFHEKPDMVIEYSAAVSAMLTKNLLARPSLLPFFIYFNAILLLKNIIYLGLSIFITHYAEKNIKYHFYAVINGTIKGIFSYIKHSM